MWLPYAVGEPNEHDCKNPQSQTAMNICADQTYRRTDAALNRVYKKVLAAEDGSGQGMLRTAQRAWVRFRDAHCAYQVHSSEGGSIQPMEYSICLTELTNQRLKQISDQ